MKGCSRIRYYPRLISHNSPKGITLLELTVVILMLTAMLLVSIPNMRGIQERNKLITATREIVGLIRYARAEAITSEHETEIRIDMEKGKYRLDLNKYKYYKVRGSGDILAKKLEQIEQIQDLPRFIRFKKVVTEADPYAREKVAKIVFFPDGSATWANIILENRPQTKGGRGREVTIEVPHATALPCVLEPTDAKTGDKTGAPKEEKKPLEDDLDTLDQIFRE